MNSPDPNQLLEEAQQYLESGQPGEAIGVYTRIIKQYPDNKAARLSLGKAYLNTGKPSKAANQLKIAVQNEPDNIEAHACLCNALLGCKELFEAAACLETARQSWPKNAGLLSALSMTYLLLGRIADAQPVCAELLRLTPDNTNVHSAYLYSFCYLPDIPPETKYREHIRWGERHAPASTSLTYPTHDRTPDRQLRVGYVSPEFRKHSVAYFILPILAQHDKTSIETFCYANLDKFDSKTAECRKLADHWREIKHLDDATVAAKIRSDGIDILVDLAGHTENNRLGVFARKPAPLQVSYIGYPATTGMAAMDYRLTDAQADPTGMTEHLHTETLIRLPGGFLCYQPPAAAPAVQSPPCLDNGHLTFGSFNTLSKFNSRLITTWAALLLQVPGSRLLLKGRMLSIKGMEEHLLRQFEARGIEPGRVECLKWRADIGDHLELYNRVDIALDTFPYNGTTTSCEALWMGVPIVTLAGLEHVSRVGGSLLTQVGLQDWITDSETAYLDCATAWAGKRDELATLRGRLRGQMAASGLCDAGMHTQVLEDAYRDIWLRWLNQTGSM